MPLPACRAFRLAALAAALLSLAACGEDGIAGGLRSAGSGTASPDEFMILPTRPLETPPDLAALPPPAPGTASRVDYQPEAEAITALTGRPAAATAPASALVARLGPADPAIRGTLAAEDQAFQAASRPRLLERLFRRDRQRLVYSGQALEPDAELRRLRALGARTPAAPPPS
ncbi:hypothetical protein BH23PSE1_BH23PSE1_11690 [soil metagenome]